MVRIYLFKRDETLEKDIPIEQLAQVLEDAKREGHILWMDIEAPTEDDFGILAEVFKFHPLSIEDCHYYSEFPKIDEFPDHIFVVIHEVAQLTSEERMMTELDIFCGKHFIVTVHISPVKAITACQEKYERNPRLIRRSADFILHGILDVLIDSYFPILDYWDYRIDQVEDDILGEEGEDVLTEMILIKRNILALRRSLAPQRDAINRLARREFAFISPQASIYFRDVSDHMMQIYNALESYRDLISSLFEVHTSMISNKMNSIMQRLTIIATIFMPLTFIVGVYGMNFRYMPELRWKVGYLVVWMVMIILGVGMYVYFKRKDWI